MSKIETIGSLTISRSSNKLVYITVEDDYSGDRILEVKLTLEDFGALVAGVGNVEGEMTVWSDANIAKKRLVKKVVTESIPRYAHDKAVHSQQVHEHFLTTEFAHDGWEVFNDGTHSRQDNKKGYEYSIIKYVPITEKSDHKVVI